MAANRPSADSPLPTADRQRSTPVFDLIGGMITDSDGPTVAPARSRFGPRSAFVCIDTAMPQTDGKAPSEGLWYLASNPVQWALGLEAIYSKHAVNGVPKSCP